MLVCLCGDGCPGTVPPSRVFPGRTMNVNEECKVRFVRRVLSSGLRCRSEHPLMVLSGSERAPGWTCDLCHTQDPDKNMPVFYCPLCDYDVCARCTALLELEEREPAIVARSSHYELNIDGVHVAVGSETPMLYCGRRYCSPEGCWCGTCDGICGPENGCPCPSCTVTFQIAALSSGLRCPAGHPLSCLSYRASLTGSTLCTKCGVLVHTDGQHRWCFGLGCNLCGKHRTFVCAECVLSEARSIGIASDVNRIGRNEVAIGEGVRPQVNQMGHQRQALLCICGSCPSPADYFVSDAQRFFPHMVSSSCWRSFMSQVYAARIRCPSGHDLQLIRESDRWSYSCSICRNVIRSIDYHLPRLRCFACDYDLCAICALQEARNGRLLEESVEKSIEIRAKPFMEEMFNIDHFKCHFGERNPSMVYCGKKHCSENNCLCGNCNGECGPTDGCACPSCVNTLFTVLLSLKLKCPYAGHLYCPILANHLPDRFSCAICRDTFDKSRFGSLMAKPALVCDCNPTFAYVCPNCTTARLSVAVRQFAASSAQSAAAAPAESASEESLKCMSCASSKVSCVFLPCGHICMCHECAEAWISRQKICPICRVMCTKISHIYFAG